MVMAVSSGVSSLLNRNNPMVLDMMGKSPIPLPLQFAMLYAGLFATLACGFFMLRGKAWARMLYVVWSIFGLVVGLATSPMKMTLIPGIVFFVLIVFFLFRPKANEFFSPAVS